MASDQGSVECINAELQKAFDNRTFGGSYLALGGCLANVRPKILHGLWQHSIVTTVLLAWSVASIWGCYFAAKRMPHLALGVVLLASFFVLTSIYVVAYFLLNIDDAWTGGMFHSIQVLLPLATFAVAWQALKKSKLDKRNEEQRGEK